MPVTLRDIAKEVNVSHTTVSLVLNNRAHKSIPPVTRARVLEAAERLGYKPNHLARALVTGRTQTAAAWTFAPFRPYYASVIRHLQKEADARNYRLLTSQTHSKWFSEGASSLEPVDWPVDGVIAMDSRARIAEYLDTPAKARVPVVSMGVFCSTSTDHVAIDIAPGIADAVRHLWKSGKRRIAFLTLAVMKDFDDPANAAYEQTILGFGAKPEYILLPLHGRSIARIEIAKYIAEQGMPDAIIGRGDELVIGAYRGLRDMGLDVPGDVALIGFGGIEDTLFTDPEISTVMTPLAEMCHTAWSFLANRLATPDMPIQSATVTAELVVRGSSPG